MNIIDKLHALPPLAAVRRRGARATGVLSALLLATAAAMAQTAVNVTDGSVRGDRFFDPAQAVYAPADVAGYRIEIKPALDGVSLAVTPPGAATFAVQLSPSAAQVNRVLVSGKSLVVISWMSGLLATEVAVFDGATGAALDRFWCFGAAPSPDGRYIAFTKFFTPHFVDHWESQYLLYDLRRDAQANRPPLRTTGPGELKPDPTVDVGSALFPLAPGEPDRDPETATVESLHERGSAFVWSADSSQLAFVDRQGGVARLVVVNMPAATPVSLTTRVAPLPQWGTVCGQAIRANGCSNVPPDFVGIELGAAGVQVNIQRPGMTRGRNSVIVPAQSLVAVQP